DVFFTMNIVLKNTGSTTINNIFYLRTVDGDNDITLPSGDYATINTIVSQLPNPSDKVLVSAVGKTYPAAYLGLGTKDCRAKVFMLSVNDSISPGFAPSAYFSGTAPGCAHAGTATLDAAI